MWARCGLMRVGHRRTKDSKPAKQLSRSSICIWAMPSESSSASFISSSLSMSSSSPETASPGSQKRRKIGTIRSMCPWLRRCPTEPDTVHMVRMRDLVSAERKSLAARVLSSVFLAFLARFLPDLPKPSLTWSIWSKMRSTSRCRRLSEMTVARTPMVVPARLRTMGRGDASCESVTLSRGSCWAVTDSDDEPNRVRRSERTFRHARTISSEFLSLALSPELLVAELEWMPSTKRLTRQWLTMLPIEEGTVSTSVFKPMAYTSRRSLLFWSSTKVQSRSAISLTCSSLTVMSNTLKVLTATV
mmetsp:Transcript_16649/g.38622  ORF Transcript_16649/g.38622 Transcript_16649/m.38622 type:complete len:302 (+) Transcript_16649:658-1563(+)